MPCAQSWNAFQMGPPDPAIRQARALAADQGMTLKEFFTEALECEITHRVRAFSTRNML